MNERETYKFGNVSGPVNAGSGNLNVGSGSQNVAGGDLTIGGTVGADPSIAAEVAALRQELAGLRLTASEREEAENHLAGVEAAADKGAAAGHLESFVTVLQKAGAVASAGAGLIEPVTKIARWIGPLAAGVLPLL